jgi:hypothetical protein
MHLLDELIDMVGLGVGVAGVVSESSEMVNLERVNRFLQILIFSLQY